MAEKYRTEARNCFNRVLSGDRTVIREINKNAAQNGPGLVIALPNTWSPHDPKAYMVQEGAPMSDVLRPRRDENRDACHKLELRIQDIHAQNPAKAGMRIETWMFKGNGKTWVNAAAFATYMGMDDN